MWFLLAAASAGVFLHAGIKFPWFVFFQKDSGLRPADPPLQHALGDGAVSPCCASGSAMVPGRSMRCCPIRSTYVPYTGAHVCLQLQLLLFSGLAFFVMLR